jgi:putative membrane protein
MPNEGAEPRDDRVETMPSGVVDATRRTYLASERTQLAWWRTGLTAVAVALGVGRVVPELDRSATKWPYVVAGVGFALWGILAIGYGTAQRAALDRALKAGRFRQPAPWALQTLTISGVGLGLLTALLILLD